MNHDLVEAPLASSLFYRSFAPRVRETPLRSQQPSAEQAHEVGASAVVARVQEPAPRGGNKHGAAHH